MNLEHQFPNDWDVTRRNFERLMQSVPDTGGTSASIRFGATGAVNAAGNATITHGLGKVPVAIFTQSANGQVSLGVDTVGATTFRVANASGTNTTGYWLVIG